jgi:hypothetical protein
LPFYVLFWPFFSLNAESLGNSGQTSALHI